MRTFALRTSLACGLIVISGGASAQTRKPGLWEVTTTMAFQQPTATEGSPHTTLVCVTKEQLDKYGAITPQSAGCQVTNIAKRPNGATADMVCTGRMDGKGALEASWTDTDHTATKVHFTGTMQVMMDTKQVEWTSNSSYVFKSSDCGSVKPAETAGAH